LPCQELAGQHGPTRARDLAARGAAPALERGASARLLARRSVSQDGALVLDANSRRPARTRGCPALPQQLGKLALKTDGRTDGRTVSQSADAYWAALAPAASELAGW
jgi:hypothetical protein